MANNWFQFKQFKVVQQHSAMKVGTDGVLLGVCVPQGNYRGILDVGTGTGLVALMMAQRFEDAQIDAVEIDHDAALEARFNFHQSPWATRLNLIHADVRFFSPTKQYDLIVSNPPFFANALKNDCHKRKMARHTDTLAFDNLSQLAANSLSPNGFFVVVLPFEQLQISVDIAGLCGLIPCRIIRVKPRADKPYKRVIIIFTFVPTQEVLQEELVVESSMRHQYTNEFFLLTKPFYLDK